MNHIKIVCNLIAQFAVFTNWLNAFLMIVQIRKIKI